MADRAASTGYEFTPEIELAVNVALATGRPLLVRGPTGSGKSSLARAVAARLDWAYDEQVITSRTEARDLLWTFDSLRRLSDAFAGVERERGLADVSHYVKPGVLWWAFDSEGAIEQLKAAGAWDQQGSSDRAERWDGRRAVILLDEIDKADPDLPNNLLVPLGALRFVVEELARPPVESHPDRPPLVIITTNDERDLPPAFLRRCVTLELKAPTAERLIRIARLHFGEEDEPLYGRLAELIAEGGDDGLRGHRTAPSAAEYLDAVWACICLDVRPPAKGEAPSELWEMVERVTISKSAQQPDYHA